MLSTNPLTRFRPRHRRTARHAPVRTVLTLALAAVALGCTDNGATGVESRDIRLVTALRDYRAGDPMTVTLENNSTRLLESGACIDGWELQTRGVWVPFPSTDACFDVLLQHAPGSATTFTFALPRWVPAGRYRLTLQSLRESGGRALPEALSRSNSFTVGPPGPTLHD